MDMNIERLNAVADITSTLGDVLEKELELPSTESKAPASSFTGLIGTAEKTCQTIAENKASLADLQDRCARDVADLLEDRQREEQEHIRRIAKIDAEIAAIRDYERRETEVWQRYIAAGRSSLLELLA